MKSIWKVAIGKEDGAVPVTSERVKENYFFALESMNRNMTDLCREVERGNTFYPYWPMWDNQSERLTVMETDEVYLMLQSLTDVGYRAESGGVFYHVPESVDVDRDIRSVTKDTEPHQLPESVQQVENLLMRMPTTILRGLISLLDKNETERVMLPIVGQSRQMQCYVIDKINLLNLLIFAYYNRLD